MLKTRAEKKTKRGKRVDTTILEEKIRYYFIHDIMTSSLSLAPSERSPDLSLSSACVSDPASAPVVSPRKRKKEVKKGKTS